ncbi:MAG TPA: cohesin domain-containing protein, partial [Blastocatellia bacterium]|nr:cohesin domain-containing protein [Blastocatellia bacterium]
RVLDGRTAVVAGIQQQTKTDGRSTIPVIGLIPILGRFITTPKESSDMSDIVITITPHIIRAPQLEKKDHLAKESGTGLGGNFVSIEHIVARAQEEDDQDRRIIAAQQGLPQPAPAESATQVSAPLTPPITTPATTNAVVQQTRPEPTPAVAQPAENQVKPQPAVNKPEPKTEPEPQENNGVLNEINAEEGGVPPPTYEPPPGYKPELKSPVITPEQREAYEAARAKAREEAKKNPPPPPSDPAKEQGVPAPTYTPPPGYRPQLIPPKKKEKEKGATSASNESKEISKAVPAQPQPEALSNSAVTVDPQLGLSLKLKDKKMQIGETFIVVVAVDGKSKMSGANIALNYDANLLQLKSVRDGGMLGKNPDITQQDKNGQLFVTLQQMGNQAVPADANGKLLILEFKAIGAGQTMIGFNTEETRFLSTDKSNPIFSVAPTQFEITRETVSKLSH